MPEEVIQEMMRRRNPRTGKNYTRQEAEAILASAKKNRSGHKHSEKTHAHVGVTTEGHTHDKATDFNFRSPARGL